MKVVLRVLENRFGEMLFGLIPAYGTIDVVFIRRRLQGECYAKGHKPCLCFVDLDV